MDNFEATSKLKTGEPVAVEVIVNELIRLQSDLTKHKEALVWLLDNRIHTPFYHDDIKDEKACSVCKKVKEINELIK